jgi:hypothetical protein
MTVQLIQFCLSLQLLQSFFQNIALKGYLTHRMTITVSILQENFLMKCRPFRSNQKMSHFHFDLSLKLSQGEVHDFSGEVCISQGGGGEIF